MCISEFYCFIYCLHAWYFSIFLPSAIFQTKEKKIEETTSASDRFGPYKTDLGLNCLLGKQ